MLHRPAESGNAAVLETMLACGFEPDAKDKDNVTPLHRAAMGGHVDAVRVLLRHGADVERDGRDVLGAAARVGRRRPQATRGSGRRSRRASRGCSSPRARRSSGRRRRARPDPSARWKDWSS